MSRRRPISYQLEIEVAKPVSVWAGKLGTLQVQVGLYIYTGSARKNIEARVRRHLTGGNAKHWHIDNLLAAQHVRIVGVRLSTVEECELNGRTPGTILFPGFGSSDCRSGCRSHLKYRGRASQT